ncbi:MAG TPA: heme ABC exporter ATP-binding protein CcmA [Gemmatimonadaceae bacterium]|nr:heme ABC exporter ATP-binding protein CcmA [Gemmatimonadaceae bacterium]
MRAVSPSADAPLLEAAGLGRSFGPRRAVSEVSFSLRAGECLALFGPNGAGKTTLLRVLAGLLKPSAGTARVAGITLPGGPPARSRIGLISHHTMLYDALSARENVAFAARLYGIRGRASVDNALERMSMLDRGDTLVRALSRGMQQRVSIARAMVHLPRLVLADEPYSGLDDNGARALTSLLRELTARGTAVIIVTHNLHEGLSLATHAAVMKAGSFVRFDEKNAVDETSYAATYRAAVGSGV